MRHKSRTKIVTTILLNARKRCETAIRNIIKKQMRAKEKRIELCGRAREIEK